MAKTTTTRKAAKKAAPRRRAPKTTRARVSTRRLPPAGASPERTLESAAGGAPAPQPRSRGALRPETVKVILDLLDVTMRPIHDPEIFFTFKRVSDNHQIGDQLQQAVAGASPSFDLPVAVNESVVCEIDPKRYRFVQSDVFSLAPGAPIRRHRVLMREPKEWTAKFTRWKDLPGR